MSNLAVNSSLFSGLSLGGNLGPFVAPNLSAISGVHKTAPALFVDFVSLPASKSVIVLYIAFKFVLFLFSLGDISSNAPLKSISKGLLSLKLFSVKSLESF